MAFLEMLKLEKRPVLILMGLFLLLRLPILLYTPLIQDEAVYTVMIEEQRAGLTLVPTFLGYPVAWKPMLFFWLNAILPVLPGPPELTFRIPSLLFSLATIAPLYLLLRSAGCSKKLTFIAMLIFLLSYITSYASTIGIIDSMLFFLITSSLLIYTEESMGRNRFLAAGFLVFLAYLTKTAVAAMAPILAIAYLFFMGRKKELADPLFLLSLAAVPLGAFIIYLVFQSSGLGNDLYISHIFNLLISPQGLLGQAKRIWSGLWILMLAAGAWFSLSLVGFARHWKENGFMALWYALGILPLVGGYFLPWYFLPVMPAISYYAAQALLRDGKVEKTDAFFGIFFAGLVAVTIATSLMVHEIDRQAFIPQRDAGLLLAGKENVLFVGQWAPGAVAYKVIGDIRLSGAKHDFGWVLFPTNQVLEASNLTDRDAYLAFIEDYWTDSYPVRQGSFSDIYSHVETFRKDTDIESFDYIMVSGFPPGQMEGFTIPGAQSIYNNSGILVFERVSQRNN